MECTLEHSVHSESWQKKQKTDLPVSAKVTTEGHFSMGFNEETSSKS